MNDAEHELTVQLRTNGHLNGGWRYATPAEIMAEHPKCVECRHVTQRLALATGFAWKECDNKESLHFGIEVYPTTDYCNKWEPK